MHAVVHTTSCVRRWLGHEPSGCCPACHTCPAGSFCHCCCKADAPAPQGPEDSSGASSDCSPHVATLHAAPEASSATCSTTSSARRAPSSRWNPVTCPPRRTMHLPWARPTAQRCLLWPSSLSGSASAARPLRLWLCFWRARPAACAMLWLLFLLHPAAAGSACLHRLSDSESRIHGRDDPRRCPSAQCPTQAAQRSRPAPRARSAVPTAPPACTGELPALSG